MSFYLTLREGPSAATSVPLLVVCDDRVIGAFLRELRRMTRAPMRPTAPLPVPPIPPVSPIPAGAPPGIPDTHQPNDVARSSGGAPSRVVREGPVQ